jgi:peptidoglycan/LPS O-acetylase OafA/YrhL
MKLINKLFFAHDNNPLHVKALDGLRGIAVLLVLLSHASNDGLNFFSFLQFYKMGKVGVYLFFILSAYLLDRQIAMALINGKSSFRYWANYFLRRFLRIYPLFVISLFIHYWMNASLTETVIQSGEDVWMHLLLLKGNSMFWSIPVEFKYYFLSPIIMLFCHRILKWNKKLIFICLGSIIIISIALHGVFHFDRVSTIRYFPFFIMGTILSIWEMLDFKKYEEIGKKIKVLSYFILGLLLFTIPFILEKITGLKPNLQHSIYYTFYAIIWAIIVYSARINQGTFGKLFQFNFLRFIGTISFSAYLFHKPILYLFTQEILIVPEYLRIYFFLFGTILFSSISYLLIEKPITKIRLK